LHAAYDDATEEERIRFDLETGFDGTLDVEAEVVVEAEVEADPNGMGATARRPPMFMFMVIPFALVALLKPRVGDERDLSMLANRLRID